MESLGNYSEEEDERQQAQEAAVVKIASILSPPEPTPAPVTTFAEPVAVGRGRGRGSAIRGAAAAVNRGGKTLNKVERMKVTLKTSLINQLANPEARPAAEQ